MSKIQIVTDSSVRLTKQEIEEYEIEIVPLKVEIDGKNYLDGIDITPIEFVEKMRQATNLPKTSQPSLGDFVGVYSKYASNGQTVLSIHMLAALSGTVNVAREAAKISHGEVIVVDSDFTDRALAFQVLKAAQMAKSGASIEEILTEIEKVRDETKVYLALPTLTNLVKGGRISRVSGVLSTIIRLKLVIELKDQKLLPVKKTRSMKGIEQFYNGVIDEMLQNPNLHSIGISYVNAEDYAKSLAAHIFRIRPDIPTLLAETGPVLATHIGEKAIAILYY
ncbi:DegV family protein [Xylocopilactobacillus apicola]|uniref:DegV family protein n=1 Tax=Xylocopilactobacillus apicola TaxID=2932184 RepID=A0AAU9DAQ5_9LACO|nr:DegV family protein [Xylocopilactobacillus apicola]BDR59480.1 hypothetical protein XA3_19210 [Xylocopilactobacillus apicola]